MRCWRKFFKGFLLVLFLIGLSCSSVFAQSGPKIYCSTSVLSFGRIYSGEKVKIRYIIENQGDQLLKVSDILPDCGCTYVNIISGSYELAPKAQLVLEVLFDSKDQGLGNINKTVYIFSNDTMRNPFKLRLQGNIAFAKSPTAGSLPTIGAFTKERAETKIQSSWPVSVVDRERFQIHYFYSNNCSECLRLKNGVLNPLKKKFRESIQIVEHDLVATETVQIFLKFQKAYQSRVKSFPVVFVGGVVLAGEKQIQQALYLKVRYYLENPLKLEMETPKILQENDRTSATDLVSEWFKSFNYWSIIPAGLLDGINPCAFATLIFFISFLIAGKYNRQSLLAIGIVFLVVSFLTYTLLGFGVLQFLRQLRTFQILGFAIEIGMALTALLLGILSIHDYILLHRGNGTREMRLQLPFKAKRFIHEVIRKRFQSSKATGAQQKMSITKLMVLSAVAAFLITLTESVCTGQIYIPTLFLISKINPANMKALFLIIIYNICFIMPLGLVLALSLLSVSVPSITKLYQQHLGTTKLITGVFLLVVSLVMVIMVLVKIV